MPGSDAKSARHTRLAVGHSHPLHQVLPYLKEHVCQVVLLWRMRRVDRSLFVWSTAQLSSQPYLIAIGGGTGRVEWLTCATLRWQENMCCPVPRMPAPRFSFSIGSWPDGRIVIAEGEAQMDYSCAIFASHSVRFMLVSVS